MGLYTKIASGEEWNILDGDGKAIATLDTETMANYMLAALLGVYPAPPDYPADEPLGEDDEGNAIWRCSCGYETAENEFWPSDGNPAPHVCPECGSTNCFFVGDGEDNNDSAPDLSKEWRENDGKHAQNLGD